MIDVEVASRVALLNAVLLVASATALLWLLWRLVVREQVLDYAPRQRVPWLWGGVVPAVLLTVFNMLAVAAMNSDEDADQAPTEQFVEGVLQLSGMNLALVVAILAVLVLGLRATRQDLGLPTSIGQVWSDAGIGVGLALAALIPIYAVQYTAMSLLDIEPSHPLLERLQSDPNPVLIIAVGFAAIVVAPVFEELVYRLLLQGALERWEDELVDWPFSRRLRKSELVLPELPELPEGDTEHRVTPGSEHLVEAYPSEDVADLARQAGGAVPGLRHGWAPILAASFLFALAHLGHGPSPIALFVFALFLGYAYQRTHRLLPSIVAHLVFNAISITVLLVAIGQ